MKLAPFSICVSLACAGALAQSGDRPGEVQNPPPASLKIPPAPPLKPEEALKTFTVAPGFRVELVASEPMIEAPVAMDWAPDGRLYVLEMRGFMPNVDGTGEDEPVGRVTLLEDTDGDGRMDKHVPFAEGLVMPRALAVVDGGLLIAEPPHLWYFKDTDGDGKADTKDEVTNDYGNQKNPEHNANGLLWGRDNWIYNANHPVRYRYEDGEWRKEIAGPSSPGQWGISQDDYGRLYYNSNSDYLRADLVPRHYLIRNPNFKDPFGDYIQLDRDQSTWPGRINPGVNRGYQRGTLREDGTLARFTGACGPGIYRGELFPKEYYGAAFVAEPTANFVRCSFVQEEGSMLSAKNALSQKEFLTSTDERFRPVNIYNGPDGALYIVDMYRGVLQHRIYLTTFLRNQAVDRGLEAPLNQGRIYRVIPEGAKAKRGPNLAKLSGAELAKALENPNGQVRDDAQQLLVERRETGSVEPLTALVRAGKFPAAMHALWALQGMDVLGAPSVLAGLKSEHPKVRATAIRVAEDFLRQPARGIVAREILAMAKDSSPEVQLQLMFSLGERKSADAEAAMAEVLNREADNQLVRDAAITGLAGRELAFLKRLFNQPAWNQKSAGRQELARDLARCVAETRDARRIDELLQFAAALKEDWQQGAILNGLAGLIPPRGRNAQAPTIRPVRFASEPATLAELEKNAGPETKKELAKIEPLLVWPGKQGFVTREVKPLTPEQQKRFDAGRELYAVICGACHQPNGQGLEGLAPPLVDSEWVTGSPGVLGRIIIHGMRGPVNVKGKVWELEMPPLFVLDDEQIASIMTFVRREWGHEASPVSSEEVGKIRKDTEDRQDAWTEADLLKLKNGGQ